QGSWVRVPPGAPSFPTCPQCRMVERMRTSAPMREFSLRMPAPINIVLHTASRVLEVEFDDGARFKLPFEFLRVYSPSAGARGRGRGQEVRQVGKRDVTIDSLQPVGHYAIKPTFSDGHDTGIYAWDYLYELGQEQAQLWSEYLEALRADGASRDPQAPASNSTGGSH